MITLFRLLRKLVLVKSPCLRIGQKNKIYSFIFTKLDNFFVIYRSGSGKNCFYSSLNQQFRRVGKRKKLSLYATAPSKSANLVDLVVGVPSGTPTTFCISKTASSARKIASLAAPTLSC